MTTVAPASRTAAGAFSAVIGIVAAYAHLARRARPRPLLVTGPARHEPAAATAACGDAGTHRGARARVAAGGQAGPRLHADRGLPRCRRQAGRRAARAPGDGLHARLPADRVGAAG